MAKVVSVQTARNKAHKKAAQGGKKPVRQNGTKNQSAASRSQAQAPVKAKTKKSGSSAKAGEKFQDYSLIFVIMFLLAFGLVMLYSTSSYEAAIKFGDSAFYLKRQLMATAAGLVVMFLVSLFPYEKLRKIALPLYWGSLVLVVLVMFIGTEVNGAKRWIYFGPISVQPAEISKIAVILVTALLIEQTGPRRLQTWKGTIRVMAPAALQSVAVLIFTRNMSSAMIIALIAGGMLFVARKDYRLFVGAAVVAGGLAVGWITYAQARAGQGTSFRSDRLLAWLDPKKYADGIGFQTLQALYGIGSGGIFGKGLGMSMQKLGYIPEAQNDMIFSIICEELGVFGAVSIILMFMILCWRFMVIANNAKDLYGGMIASGVLTHIAVQVILNIAVVTNTIPNTGVTLPFISYGGSAVMILLAEVGVVINISRITLKNL